MCRGLYNDTYTSYIYSVLQRYKIMYSYSYVCPGPVLVLIPHGFVPVTQLGTGGGTVLLKKQDSNSGNKGIILKLPIVSDRAENMVSRVRYFVLWFGCGYSTTSIFDDMYYYKLKLVLL